MDDAGKLTMWQPIKIRNSQSLRRRPLPGDDEPVWRDPYTMVRSFNKWHTWDAGRDQQDLKTFRRWELPSKKNIDDKFGAFLVPRPNERKEANFYAFESSSAQYRMQLFAFVGDGSGGNFLERDTIISVDAGEPESFLPHEDCRAQLSDEGAYHLGEDLVPSLRCRLWDKQSNLLPITTFEVIGFREFDVIAQAAEAADAANTTFRISRQGRVAPPSARAQQPRARSPIESGFPIRVTKARVQHSLEIAGKQTIDQVDDAELIFQQALKLKLKPLVELPPGGKKFHLKLQFEIDGKRRDLDLGEATVYPGPPKTLLLVLEKPRGEAVAGSSAAGQDIVLKGASGVKLPPLYIMSQDFDARPTAMYHGVRLGVHVKCEDQGFRLEGTKTSRIVISKGGLCYAEFDNLKLCAKEKIKRDSRVQLDFQVIVGASPRSSCLRSRAHTSLSISRPSQTAHRRSAPDESGRR